jgi:ABC-type tungstate transport system substrate-binding protein
MMMQINPADTTGYMILGFVVILLPILIYLMSMVIRFRNLNHELGMLEEIGVQERKKK